MYPCDKLGGTSECKSFLYPNPPFIFDQSTQHFRLHFGCLYVRSADTPGPFHTPPSYMVHITPYLTFPAGGWVRVRPFR